MKSSWKGIFETVGIIAVVVSLILVYFEINQNNELMAAEARYNRLNASIALNMAIAQDSQISLAHVHVVPASELTPEENVVLRSFWWTAFAIAEWTYYDLNSNEWPIKLWKARFNSTNGNAHWNDRKNEFSDEFINYIDENVVEK